MRQLGDSRGKTGLHAALGLVALCACSNADDGANGFGDPNCVGSDAPEPVIVDATVRVVATGQERIVSLSTQLSPAFIADGSGIYWHDTRGAVFAQRRGETSVQLLPSAERVDGAPREAFILGMAASADQIYVAEGYLPTNLIDYFGIGEFDPPSRLLAVPKQGGPATVVLESEDSTLWPLAAIGERLIVMALADAVEGVSYYQVELGDPRLQPLPLGGPNNYLPRSAGDALYWVNGEHLMRSGFDDAQPQQVTSMTSFDFSVGPGYVLTREAPNAINTVDVQDGSSACTQLPRSAPLNSSAVALAPRHIYYLTLKDGGSGNYLTASGELVQLELETGALTRMNMPGITLQNDLAILGQDAESLYVQNGDTLLAVQKP
jgi:hypothetical protein